MLEKRPWFKFRPETWLADPHLRLTSVQSRGILIDLMALAHNGKPYGFLTNGGLAMTVVEMAAICRVSKRQMDKALSELLRTNRVSLTDRKVYYVPSMVDADAAAEAASLFGKMGGNPNLKTADLNRGVKPKVNGGLKGGVKPEKNKNKNKNNNKEAFDCFWNSYPAVKRINRVQAFKAFCQTVRLKDMPSILAALERQKLCKRWQNHGGDFIPAPANWLKDERWNDATDGAQFERLT